MVKMRCIFIVYYTLLTSGILCLRYGRSAVIECPASDRVCERDKLGFEAIGQLHNQIDDDHNGNLDRSESDEYIREELKYEDGFDRQATFHGSDDQISIQDLWVLWIQSDVYNWTVDDVIEWLVTDVELPQYMENFRINDVDGHVLPRLAANGQFMSNILGIKNGVHKQKVALKATDLVLFGPPKKGHSYVKDLALVMSLVIAVGGCWLAYIQNKYSQAHLKKVMKDLDTLQKAEDELTEFKEKLDRAEKGHQEVAEEKTHLEKTLKDEIEQAKSEAERLRQAREASEEEMSMLKLAEEELVQVRMALRQAEEELEEKHNAPLAELQQWLQMTYEIECKYHDIKREAAEKQLNQAKEMCEKIRRKRGAFMGSFRIAHTTSLDDTDHSIMSARAALEEVQRDMKERSQRWRQMEKICGFNIILNPGLQYLESLLRGAGHPLNSSAHVNGRGVVPCNVDDNDEDMPPGNMTSSGR